MLTASDRLPVSQFCLSHQNSNIQTEVKQPAEAIFTNNLGLLD
ncbi:hypothetical protein [Myxosarcina sp. GI1(2024)]